MALIRCPECGREKVSSSATACPECGFGIAAWYTENETNKEIDENQKVIYNGKDYTVCTLNREALSVDQKNGNHKQAKEKWLFLLNTQPANSYVKKNVTCNLGYYYLGDIEYNVPKAIEYLCIAAQTENPEAEAMLGNIYNPQQLDKSLGGTSYVDANKAITWYRKAASHGHIYAMNNIGVLFGGYKKNYVVAAFYCWIAFKSGNKGAEQNYIEYSKIVPSEYLSIIRRYSSINDIDNFINSIEEHENQKPKCPICKSNNISLISGTRRFVSVGLFGIGSADIGKSMRCKDCGYRW